MKLLCISNYYPPHYLGGYELSIKESVDYFEKQGHEVLVVCGRRGTISEPELPSHYQAGDILRILKYIDYSGGNFFSKTHVERYNYRICKEVIRQYRPDLVYLGNLQSISIAPAIAVQKLRVPRLYDIGDIWLKSYISSRFSNRLFRFLKRLCPLTVGGKLIVSPAVVPSKWLKERLVNSYGATDVHVVPRGIELPEAVSRSFSAPLRCVFAGRIEPRKGLDLCIHALAALKQLKPELHLSLDVYGDEDTVYMARCHSLIESYGFGDLIRFHGKSIDMLSTLAAYDLLLMPTLAEEAFGRIIIEAMALGLIVIATDAYGPSEIITNGVDGFLFERGSASELAASLETCYSAPPDLLHQISTSARKTVSERYSLATVKGQIEEIILKLGNFPKQVS